jgi:hypothetical protein
MVARTGSGRRPPPRCSASLVPTTAVTGKPAVAAAEAIDDARTAGTWPEGRTDRQASTPRTVSSAAASTHPPPASTSGSAFTPRAGSNCLTAPTGVSGETATAPATARPVPPSTATAPVRSAASTA